MMGRWDGGGMGSGGWLAMGLMMVVFWTVVIAAVVIVVRGASHSHADLTATLAAPDPALRILDERFARGEIDAEEYAQRRDLLRSG